MSDSVLLHKFSEFFRSELRVVVGHQLTSIRSFVIVRVVVADLIGNTSGHLEWASTTIKNMEFKNGPAKSTCKRSHGVDGHSQGCTGAVLVILLVC